jgi:hypothetical protein
VRTKQRTPKWRDAKQRRELIDKAIARAVQDPAYRPAYDAADVAFDAIVATGGAEAAVEAFFGAVAAVVDVARTAAGPFVAELTTPTADGFPPFARWVIDEIAAHHPSPLAGEIRDELAKMPMQSAIPPRSLETLRGMLGEARKRGQPPGPSGQLKGLDVEQTETRILREMAQLTRVARRLTVAAVAVRLGMERRTLEQVMQHHGLVWTELKQQAKREQAKREKDDRQRKREKDDRQRGE